MTFKNIEESIMQLDWKNLPFGYISTDYNVRCYYRNGEWGEFEISSSEQLTLHIAATCLHYGQESFEGTKAFMGKDGQVRLFRWQDNAKRMIASAQGILMAEFPVDRFGEAIKKVVSLNKRFIPPYESGASLYIRPLLIGTGPQIGVKPAEEYLFMIFVTPVGPYFKSGFKPLDIMICRRYDRAAPLGTGNLKVGGNYAAGLRASKLAHQENYASVLFLDPKDKHYIDECGPANFFGIKGSTYVTPNSDSILPSITNASLMKLAEMRGMTVERRRIAVDELNDFDEVGACGTAAVITPVRKIVDPESGKIYQYCKDEQAGPVSSELYHSLRDIQYGLLPDPDNWVEIIT